MARLMSVMLTEQQVVDRSKTVTRRTGWEHLRAGTPLTLCRKVRGRKPGEPLVRLAEVEVVTVDRVVLADITTADVVAEGFPQMSVPEFVEFFCATHSGCSSDTEVTRIEWRYLDVQEVVAS